jgi:hypothetical protein
MSDIKWIEPAENPWGVPVLDVRPVTLTMLSASHDPRCAKNAISYGQDDGACFIDQKPPIQRTVNTSIQFRRDRLLADGALFVPREMEHKWAIYFRQNRIIFIRSWLRTVFATAEVEQSGDEVRIVSLQGVFVHEQEDPGFSVQVMDYLLRSHALGLEFPVPLLLGMEYNLKQAALWCFSCFGKLALYATSHEIRTGIPGKPLRSHSVLHIAVARGDKKAVDKYLNAGVPVDLLAADGLAPLHWALTAKRRRLPLIGSWDKDTVMLQHLLQCGSPVDVRSAERATPLMNAVQTGNMKQVSFLLDHGADPSATDDRGFTALHRAAEMGKTEMVRILLARGASPDVEAQGHTPLSLAEGRKCKDIVKLLKNR